ncbi:hypothetical protein D3C80_1887460 [compost metagenome]
MPCIFVAVRPLIRRLVNTDQAWMLGIAARDRMILKLAKSPRERHVFRVAQILISQKQHTMFEQCRADLRE